MTSDTTVVFERPDHFAEGVDAYNGNLSSDSNPYDGLDNEGASLWLDGYESAREAEFRALEDEDEAEDAAQADRDDDDQDGFVVIES